MRVGYKCPEMNLDRNLIVMCVRQSQGISGQWSWYGICHHYRGLVLLSHIRLVRALWQLGIISEVSGKKSVLSRASEINGIHGLDVVWTKHDGNHSQPPQTRQTFPSKWFLARKILQKIFDKQQYRSSSASLIQVLSVFPYWSTKQSAKKQQSYSLILA